MYCTVLHCKQYPIYVFLEMKLFPISTFMYVSVSDLYIPSIGPPILLQQNRQTHGGNI